MISAQTLRVCREGKPLHTFPDHALAGFPAEPVSSNWNEIVGWWLEVGRGDPFDQAQGYLGLPRLMQQVAPLETGGRREASSRSRLTRSVRLFSIGFFCLSSIGASHDNAAMSYGGGAKRFLIRQSRLQCVAM